MKAYKLKAQADSTERICNSCEEAENFSESTQFRMRSMDHMWDEDGYIYYDTDSVTVTVWRCGGCGWNTEEEPDLVQSSTWVCGSCEAQFDDEDDAVECCL